jgi:hypothetical protein
MEIGISQEASAWLCFVTVSDFFERWVKVARSSPMGTRISKVSNMVLPLL